MRLCGGFGRASALMGACFLSFSLSACLGPNAGPTLGSSSEPQEYLLAAAGTPQPAAKPVRKVSETPPVSGSAEFAARAGDVVLFDGDSSELSPRAKATLRKQVRWLRSHPEYRVLVEGHADEWGSPQYNLTLAAERAVAVQDYLRNNGLRSVQIQTISYGKERRVASCASNACQSRNRRARTVVTLPPA